MAYRTELVQHESKTKEPEWKVKITFPSAANATDYMNQVNAIEADRAAVPATEPTTALVKLPSAALPKQEEGNKKARIIFQEGAEKAKVWLCQTGLEPCFRDMKHRTIHLSNPTAIPSNPRSEPTQAETANRNQGTDANTPATNPAQRVITNRARDRENRTGSTRTRERIESGLRRPLHRKRRARRPEEN